ncbi:hypothetical protein [Legionella sp. WA2022007384]
MVQIVFFTDPGKDGDDLLATIHLMIQAKASGFINPLTQITLLTSDEIPCDEYGVQRPDGKYGLRALYLKMYIEKLQKQFNLPKGYLPEVIAGPVTSYYRYNEQLQKYHHEPSQSDAFYPSKELIEYYQQSDVHAHSSCLLSPENQPNDWLEKIKLTGPEDTTIINIASFNAVSDFLAQIPPEEKKKYSLINMGYNKPYEKDDYQSNVEDPNKLPYNSRSTDASKAAFAVSALTYNNAFHVVSKTTRTLPLYSEVKSIKDAKDVISRAYPVLTGQYSPALLTGVVEFIKSSKYKGFWPHDVVASLMALIGIIKWKHFIGTEVIKEMMFRDTIQVPADGLRLRMVNNTGVLIDSSLPVEKDDIAIESDENFIYGKEIDPIFFTSLLHLTAAGCVKGQSSLFNCYKNIIKLKAELYNLKQQGKTDPEKEKKVNSLWIKATLLELQQQLKLQAQENLDAAMKDFLGAETSEAENKNALRENLLQWAREIEAFVQLTGDDDLPESMIQDINKALQQPTTEKKYTALTGLFVIMLRSRLMPTESACALLQQDGKLGVEFKRTANSLLYYKLAAQYNYGTAFSNGILGMSYEYATLLSLEKHCRINKEAFYLHLALHDAGKGDRIKNAVHRDIEGNYLIRLPSGNYIKCTEAKETSPTDVNQFARAKEYVDHDIALELYGFVGSQEKNCTATEYLLWEGPAPAEKEQNKKAFILCDELFNLCNEMNIAQIIQGEIPFSGIKKGLDLFFAAYKKYPYLAELVFVHHCFDIFGAKPSDSMISAAGSTPEIHLKINLLYNTLCAVAQKPELDKEAAEEAYTLYRKILAKAIPDILSSDPSSHDLAVTRIAQMLRCHLFKTIQYFDSNYITINEAGKYEARTRLFVESIDSAFHQLPRGQRQKLVSYLNNTGTGETPAVMVMYGPKLFLTATTGAEYAKTDPTDKAKITECLSPMLKLYANLYEFQLTRSRQYSVIDINELAQIVEQVFTWYKDAGKQQKDRFADLLFQLQIRGQAKAFLAQLGDVKSKSALEQLTKMQECIKAAGHSSIVTEERSSSSSNFIEYETRLRTTLIHTIYADLQKSNLDKVEKNNYKKAFLTFQLEHLPQVSEWQLEARKANGLVDDIKIHRESIFTPDSPKEAANKALLEVIKYLIIDTQWDIGYFGGEKVKKTTGEENLIPKGMYAVLQEIEKAETGLVNFSKTVEKVSGMIDASAKKKDHWFFNKRGETSQIFYDKAQTLLREDAEENFAPSVY